MRIICKIYLLFLFWILELNKINKPAATTLYYKHRPLSLFLSLLLSHSLSRCYVSPEYVLCTPAYSEIQNRWRIVCTLFVSHECWRAVQRIRLSTLLYVFLSHYLWLAFVLCICLLFFVLCICLLFFVLCICLLFFVLFILLCYLLYPATPLM